MAGVSLETIVFFYDFHGLGGLRSTQPTETAVSREFVNIGNMLEIPICQILWVIYQGTGQGIN